MDRGQPQAGLFVAVEEGEVWVACGWRILWLLAVAGCYWRPLLQLLQMP